MPKIANFVLIILIIIPKNTLWLLNYQRSSFIPKFVMYVNHKLPTPDTENRLGVGNDVLSWQNDEHGRNAASGRGGCNALRQLWARPLRAALTRAHEQHLAAARPAHAHRYTFIDTATHMRAVSIYWKPLTNYRNIFNEWMDCTRRCLYGAEVNKFHLYCIQSWLVDLLVSSAFSSTTRWPYLTCYTFHLCLFSNFFDTYWFLHQQSFNQL